MRDPVSSIIWRPRQQLRLEYDRWRPRNRNKNTNELGFLADDATFVKTIPNQADRAIPEQMRDPVSSISWRSSRHSSGRLEDKGRRQAELSIWGVMIWIAIPGNVRLLDSKLSINPQ
jgi:hypothetical protein